jgi:hypothetical protein
LGGGLSVLTGSSANISTSTIVGNLAQGGAGGAGGNGGNGFGGGVFIDTGASLDVTLSAILGNQALGGEGGHGGSDGEGIGGGVYDLGTFTDLATLIVGNLASTSNDNIYP